MSSFLVFSQNKQIFIYGKVIDSASVIKNANIVNIKTNTGTFSNDDGEFRMLVSLGDSLRISSIQHTMIHKVITKQILEDKKFTIQLVKKTYLLDEIFLKDNNLIGSLTSDRKQTPKDKKAEALKNTMDFSKMDMKAKVADDYIDKRVRPPENSTDPNQSFVGAGAKIGFAFKYSERLWALRRKIAYQKQFPKLLLQEFGEKFFFQDLKIPKNKYHHFLAYCNPLGIENLYLQKQKLEVIKILKNESIGYLKILKENAKNTENDE
ncbi:MAG: hypothetical protein JXQ93_09550 [Flavobacteriaceae bacterium]